MKFSVYSEIQNWGGKDPARQYDEVLEQMVHADRLGYDAYAIIEHNFFPQFSISSQTRWVLFGESIREERSRSRSARWGTCSPTCNPTWLASAMAAASIMLEGRYEAGLLRGHGWLPTKTGVPVARHAKPLRGVARDHHRGPQRTRASPTRAKHFEIDECHVVPRPNGQHSDLPRRHQRSNLRARRRAGVGRRGSTVAALCGTRGADGSSTARKCAEHGTDPYIIWIHACYIDEDRDVAWREAETGHAPVPARATHHRSSPARSSRRTKTWRPPDMASTSRESWRTSRRCPTTR